MCEAARSNQNENICIGWFSKQHIRGCRGDGCNLLSAQTSDQNKNTNSGAHVSICHMPSTPPFGTQPSPKQSLWGLQHSQSGLLKYTAWQINRAAIQGRSLDWDSRGVGRRGEMHSTLINTWPHYLSHVAESHWGKFNTALLSWGMVVFACMDESLWFSSPYVNIKSFARVYLLYLCVCLSVCEHTCIFSCLLVCVCVSLRVWARLCVGLDSLWCQDSIKSFNIAIMRGCLILFARSLPLPLFAALCIPKQPLDKTPPACVVKMNISLVKIL